MGKLLKWILGIVVGLVVLIALAAVVLPMVIDPNDYKGQIVAAVKKQTGRDLEIADPLKLSVFPWLGIETGGVTFGNAPGFGKQPFAQVRKLGVRVKLMPLLSRRVEVDTLVLDGARLNLQKNAQGVTNWDDLSASGKQARQPEAGGQGKGETGPGLAALRIQGIQLSDARIRWDDAQSGAHYVLDGVHLKTGALRAGAAVPVAAGLVLTGEKPRLRVVLDLNTTVKASHDFKRIDLHDLTLTIDGKGEGLPSDGLELKLDTEAALDLAADTLKLDKLRLSGPQTEISGAVDIAKLRTAPQLTGDLKLSETNLKQLARVFGAPIETTDPKALTRVSATIHLAHEGKATRLDPFHITLDDTQASGFVRILNPKGPVVRARLDVDSIDLDRYLPPAGKEAPAGSKSAPAAKRAGGDPFAALRPLDLQADIKIGRLVVSKAKMQDVTVHIRSQHGVLKVAPIAARLYQGKLDGDLTLDARHKTPKVHVVKHLVGIQIGPLLKDVMGEDKLLGRGDVHLDLRTVGLSEAQVRRSLNGNGRFVFADGAYKGVDIVKLIKTASGRGAGPRTQSGNSQDKTEFTELKASFTARHGVISNQDLSAKSPLLRLGGKGTVDLASNRIDYVATVKLVASLQGQGGAAADQLKGVPIPVRIKGALDKPSYSLDIGAILSEKAKQQVRKKVENKVRKALGDKLKGSLGNGLKGLFGN
jgi:AsmA protein